MKKIEEKLILKYLNDESSEEEKKLVLRWFKTPEGFTYLERLLDCDIRGLQKKVNHSYYYSKKPDTERLLSAIKSNIWEDLPGKKDYRTISKRDYSLPLIKLAVFLVVALFTLFIYLIAYEKQVDEPEEVVSRHYTTSEGEQKLLTLHDGSTVLMNGNSQVWVHSDNFISLRELELEGEAYFDVVDIPERPFIIHAKNATIEVLGTAFNVKTYDWHDNVQVAVSEGRVSFTSKLSHLDKRSVTLAKGQFAYFDFNDNDFVVENFGVENYLVWKSGRLIFEDLPLEKVCLQLSRLYDVECSFDDKALKDLSLTSNFSGESLDKTLSVIALSLGINYQFDNDKKVVWKHNNI